MKTLRKLAIWSATAIITVLAFTGCKGTDTLKPNISGKAGEVIVVMDRTGWEGNLGNEVREVLGADCPFLAQREPLYSLANVAPAGFTDMFKVHRNILIFNLDPNVVNEGTVYRYDEWARPQCVIQVNARTAEAADTIFVKDAQRIISTLEQAERDRVIMNSKQYEETSLAEVVTPVIGGSPHFPIGYQLKKKTDDFIWIADERQYSTQGILIYKYPADKKENFTAESIITHRNEILKNNVPGMFDNTWMTTSDYVIPTVEFIKFRGRQFAQTRGYWEVHNDFMGGPFVSQAFYSKDNSEIIVLEAFVYAPKFDKRQYLRQVESILYSFEWKKDEEEMQK